MNETLLEPVRRIEPMAKAPDPETRTVRIDSECVELLGLIAAMKTRMGERFKSVEFLNELVMGPITELYKETQKVFASWEATRGKTKPKK